VPTVSLPVKTFLGTNEDLNEDNSSESAVENSIVAKDVVSSPPKKRLKKFNEEAIIMGQTMK